VFSFLIKTLARDENSGENLLPSLLALSLDANTLNHALGEESPGKLFIQIVNIRAKCSLGRKRWKRSYLSAICSIPDYTGDGRKEKNAPEIGQGCVGTKAYPNWRSEFSISIVSRSKSRLNRFFFSLSISCRLGTILGHVAFFGGQCWIFGTHTASTSASASFVLLGLQVRIHCHNR